MKVFAKQLKHERELHVWSQAQVAEMVGTTAPNVSRWERGVTLPSLYFRQKLAELFGKSAEELGVLEGADDSQGQASNQVEEEQHITSSPPVASSLFWNLPHQRNPLFTGREEVLVRLHRTLNSGEASALTQAQAISGLGGSGKTALAMEYAYRYSDEYQSIFWVRGEIGDVLLADFAAIVRVLDLPEQEHQTQHQAIEAVKWWLERHTHWLLLVDNLEELALLHEFIPFKSQGHIILTTRTQSTGSFVQRLDLLKMQPGEGALFLLRRAKRLGPGDTLEQAVPADGIIAREISLLLDGLPLALDQAGAYIEEAACSLSHYFELLQRHRAALLDLRDLSGGMKANHPHSVYTTLTLSFERIAQANPAAMDLLRLCAFLHPDDIPEEMLTEGGPDLSPLLQEVASSPFKYDVMIAELRRYSLLQRNPETKTLSLHRLVQAVVQDTLEEAAQREWSERVVRVVSHAFPEVEYATWERCQWLLPQALCSASLIEQWDFVSPDAARLLIRTGLYLKERGAFGEALPLVERALALREQAFGATHPDVAEGLNELAVLYYTQGKYEQALPLYERALAINEQTHGSSHPLVAANLNNLAVLYYTQGKYEQALPLYERALAINEQTHGSSHPLVAANLNNLAELYRKLQRYEQALTLYQRTLVIKEQTIGPTHPSMATSLNNLAMLYRTRGQYEQALPLYERALAIREQALGLTHPEVALVLSNLADLYREQGQYEQALPLFERALAIQEGALGPNHPAVARCLEKYAALLRAMQQPAQAEVLEGRAQAIQTQRTLSGSVANNLGGLP